MVLIYITQNPTQLAPRRHVYGSAARISSKHTSQLLNSQSMSNQMGTPEDKAAKLESFNLAASPYFEEIRRFCMSKMKNTQRGEDIAQEALMKAFNAWDTFTDQGKGPKSWMFKIASNLLINAGIAQTKLDEKTQYVYTNAAGVDNHGFDKFDFANDVDTPELLVMEKFGMADIEAAVQSLSDEFREVAYLKFIVELSNIEIAKELGLSQNTVGSKVSRSREKLSEALKEMAAGYGIGLDEEKKK
jgi:RNA polymerase sigma-70 factor (ECF subfamily)